MRVIGSSLTAGADMGWAVKVTVNSSGVHDMTTGSQIGRVEGLMSYAASFCVLLCGMYELGYIWHGSLKDQNVSAVLHKIPEPSFGRYSPT